MIDWIEGDATSLPDGPFNLVLCQQGLQFFPDPVEALREMHRVLNGSGRVALSVWQSFDLHVVYKTLLEATASQLGANVDSVAHAWSLGEERKLRPMFEAAGFQHVDISQSSLEVQFPTPEQFVELTILGGATTIPTFADLSDEARSGLIEMVKAESETVLNEHQHNGFVSFPMYAHLIIADQQSCNEDPAGIRTGGVKAPFLTHPNDCSGSVSAIGHSVRQITGFGRLQL